MKNSNPQLSSSISDLRSASSFLVRWRGYAVFFHTNACGKNYSLVADAEATHFTSMTEAMMKAKMWGLRQSDLKIERAAV